MEHPPCKLARSLKMSTGHFLYAPPSPFGEFPLNLNRSSQPFADQAQGERAFYLAVQQLQQDTVVNFIKEAFQVDINDVPIARVNVFLRFEYGLLCVAVRPETIAVVFKFHLEFDGQNLTNGLLKQSVRYGRHAQQAGFAVAFG